MQAKGAIVDDDKDFIERLKLSRDMRPELGIENFLSRRSAGHGCRPHIPVVFGDATFTAINSTPAVLRAALPVICVCPFPRQVAARS
jgi:hypothetical protein